MISEWKCNYLL